MSNPSTLISELQPGTRVVGYYLLRHKQVESFRDRSRGTFLTLQLADRTGQVLGRIWENIGTLQDQMHVGDVVKVAADVELWQDRAQLNIQKIRVAQPDEFDWTTLRPSSTRTLVEMQAEFNQQRQQVQNPHLQQLLQLVFNGSVLTDFQAAPAARQVHHIYQHGLLEHTLEMCQLIEPLCQLYPELNHDLLLSGVLLHDIGKIREYDWQTDTQYTDEGRLIGHITIGFEIVTDAIKQFPDFPADLALQLKHLLLSHHGRYEWGSPRRPKTLEAVALHHLDDLLVQVNRFRTILTTRRQGQERWTEYDRLLGRALYAGESAVDLEIEESSQLS
jgi:3'-5' exoribonuclease